MSKTLVIVESPGKINKISSYLGSDYIVKASFGHCQDLDPNSLSIDIENNYKPIYINIKDKEKIINELKTLSKKAKDVILASDQDREGEAIAASLSTILKLKNPKRIIFNEITKKAILDAINNPSEINYNLVHAQQARRLLDRLVGYKISPILWKHLKNENNNLDVLSAGRVQSVVVKIIIDKEEEIKNSLNNLYLKTTCNFIKNKKNIKSVLLNENDEIYKFDNDESANNFIKLINKNTIFKVVNIVNKEILKNPSPPFITSTLQQVASTKLNFNTKKTMDIAQKLYENGYITYMRTDSTNLSNDFIENCINYININFGENYSNKKIYKSDTTSQEAHEAIRPTNIKDKEITSNNNEEIKLYNLIWKRTIASQMKPAKLNNQIIKIDTFNNDKSILINFKSLWTIINENIIFDGFLKVYNEETIDENIIDINENEILKFNKIIISEEYTKSPLRFNEAGLIKFLEKNTIGRPSTYVSIINKILDRKYVEIKNIDGEKKKSKEIELNNKFIIKETINEMILGNEKKKIIPTQIGIIVNNFMTNNFDSIMQIDFTATFENYLDKIANGGAKWYNVLDIFYKKFNPMIQKLEIIKNIDKLLGIDPKSHKEIFIGNGKYGPYIKIMNNNKWKFYSIDNLNISIEEAIKLLRFPIDFGKLDRKNIAICNGRYGIYLKYGDKNISLDNDIDIDTIDLEYIKNIISSVH